MVHEKKNSYLCSFMFDEKSAKEGVPLILSDLDLIVLFDS